MESEIRLLTIDAAGTLIRPWPSVGAVYAQTAREHGLKVEDDQIDKRFYEIFGDLQKNKKITQGEEKEFWRSVVWETFRPFTETKTLDPIFEKLWNLFAQGDHWRLSEHAVSSIQTIRKRGYQVALLSNNDSRLRQVIQDLGIEDLFDELFISAEIGYEKPQLEIFRHVEENLQKQPLKFSTWGTVIPVILKVPKKQGGPPCYSENPNWKKIKFFAFQNCLNGCHDRTTPFNANQYAGPAQTPYAGYP